MKLYVTPTSPYARLARIIVLEKGLGDQVEVIAARTRERGSPYYETNPSGRVPYLVLDDGTTMEDSTVICALLDTRDCAPRFHPSREADGWAYARLEAMARSFTDGISVWGREMRRPQSERSPTILAHEVERARRLADAWERQIGHPLMQGAPNMAQLALLVGIDYARHAGMPDVTAGHPALAAFVARLHAVPSIAATAPSRPLPPTT